MTERLFKKHRQHFVDIEMSNIQFPMINIQLKNTLKLGS